MKNWKMNCLLLLFLVGLNHIGYTQDIITKKDGSDIKAKVYEVTQTDIKYKRFESPDGPLYTMSKSDILIIRYKDGTKDIFAEKEASKEHKETVNTSQTNAERLGKGKKVFIVTFDNAIAVHGIKALKNWGYWKICEEKEDADILIDFIVERKGLAFKCHIEIINPITKGVIIKTSNSICYAADYGNPKKAAIEENVKQKLRPLVISYK